LATMWPTLHLNRFHSLKIQNLPFVLVEWEMPVMPCVPFWMRIGSGAPSLDSLSSRRFRWRRVVGCCVLCWWAFFLFFFMRIAWYCTNF
jgi:hypothetical protein